MRVTSVPGTMRVFAPGATSEATVAGRTDIVMILIDVGDLKHTIGGWPDPALLNLVDERVRAAAICTFVAACAGDMSRSRQASTALRRGIGELLLSKAHAGDLHQKGGLRPTARCRVEGLIERRLREGRPPGVEELAAEAALSVNHFIRAYRESTGTTPYQQLVVSRQQKAMALLGESGLPVADVANLLGFCSPAHFGMSFRKKLGVTPGEYRDALLGSGGPSGVPLT